MQTRPELTRSDVDALLAAAAAEALAQRWAVSIAVTDDGGHLLGFTRLDGASPLSSHVAQAKARSAAMGRRETRLMEESINGGRYAFLSVPAIDGLLEGGVPIVSGGHCLGAVGVSGVQPAQDAQVAKAGIAALGLPG